MLSLLNCEYVFIHTFKRCVSSVSSVTGKFFIDRVCIHTYLCIDTYFSNINFFRREIFFIYLFIFKNRSINDLI